MRVRIPGRKRVGPRAAGTNAQNGAGSEFP
jgi:hypothetical protein